MSEKILKATHGSDKTALLIGQVEIPCYVLEDGTRVLSGRGMQKALKYEKKSGDWLSVYFIKESNGFSAGLVERMANPLKFKRINASGSQPKTYGFEATVLIDICGEIIDLKSAGLLQPKYDIYATQAEIIIRSVAKVGIIALIDEVTGYQNTRVADELNKFFNKFLLEEAKKYEVTFPLELYQQWFRLNGWEWKPENAQKRTPLVGKYTKNLIYERIAPGILKELERRNPKNEKGYRDHKHFQFLTEEIGTPKLREFFGGLIALSKATSTWRKYMDMVNRVYPRYGDTLYLDYPNTDVDY